MQEVEQSMEQLPRNDRGNLQVSATGLTDCHSLHSTRLGVASLLAMTLYLQTSYGFERVVLLFSKA
jgi:hypothetical protein